MLNNIANYVFWMIVTALLAMPFCFAALSEQKRAAQRGRKKLGQTSLLLAALTLVVIGLAWAYSYPWTAHDYTQLHGTTYSLLITIVLGWVLVFLALAYGFLFHRTK